MSAAPGPAAPARPGPAQQIAVTPGTAFKTGFFFTLGSAVAGLIIMVVYFVIIFVIFGSVISAMMPGPLNY